MLLEVLARGLVARLCVNSVYFDFSFLSGLLKGILRSLALSVRPCPPAGKPKGAWGEGPLTALAFVLNPQVCGVPAELKGICHLAAVLHAAVGHPV